jgi:protein-L-isoaspartate O-methyltransferase
VHGQQKVREQKALLSEAIQTLKTKPVKPLAVDLGSGSGFQTVVLAELGFSPVIAIDIRLRISKRTSYQ